MDVIISGLGLERNERVVTRDDERSKVGQKLANATDVEEDQKKVDKNKTEHAVGLGDASLGLELLESRVLVKFLDVFMLDFFFFKKKIYIFQMLAYHTLSTVLMAAKTLS